MIHNSLFGAMYGLTTAAVDEAAEARKIGVIVMELEVCEVVWCGLWSMPQGVESLQQTHLQPYYVYVRTVQATPDPARVS